MLTEVSDMPCDSHRDPTCGPCNGGRVRISEPSRDREGAIGGGGARRRFVPARYAVSAAIGAVILSGCTGISVEPSCPTEMVVGESGTLEANEKNEGAIPKYLWEAIPAEAGTIAEADQPTTTFVADATGKVTFRLTARDGLFQAISECSTEVIMFTNIAVTLEAGPAEPAAGDTVTLTCETGRVIANGTRTIEQVDGEPVELDVVAEGVATFTPSGGEDVSFRCIAASGDGEQAESSLLAIAVPPSTNDQDDDDTDDNGGDDDDADNGNDNGTAPPVRR